MIRTYTVGVPLVIEVDEAGHVTFEVDLSEIDLSEYAGSHFYADQAVIAATTAELGYTHRFTA